jgi:DNA-binding HxlR family transcriptional regulator
MPEKPRARPRSWCPVSMAVEILGDRWSLLIIRDLMVRGLKTFKEFRQAGEGIATNILADRLETLAAKGIITCESDSGDRRKVNYRLTQKGIELAPVLLELLIWGARHHPTAAPCQLIENMARNRKQVLAEVERRWWERDPSPLLPPFRDDTGVAPDGDGESGVERVRKADGDDLVFTRRKA